MDGHAGYHWRIEDCGGVWIWSIFSPADGAVLLTATASSRPHAAACVVRALIRGVTQTQQAPSLAA